MGRDMGSRVEGTPIGGTGWCKNDQNWGRPQLDEKPMKNGKDGNELTSDIPFVLNSKTYRSTCYLVLIPDELNAARCNSAQINMIQLDVQPTTDFHNAFQSDVF